MLQLMLEKIKQVCKKLASSDEPVRTKGFLGAKKLLGGAESVSFDNMLLIMKGLHYMLWMQDQPIKHEDIVDMICSLLEVISRPEDKLNFIKALFETEAREWSSIDFWRADKFMMLIRRFLKASLAFLQSSEWNGELVNQFVQILRDSGVNADFNQSCNGLKLHLADIICEELSITNAGPDAVLAILRPFIDIVAGGMHKHHVVDKVEQAVLQYLADQALYRAESAQEEDAGGSEVCLVNVDMEKLCDCLLALGSDPIVKSPNRKRLFHWYKTFKNIVSGNLEPESSVPTGPKLGKEEIASAVARLIKQENKRKKKKKKRPIEVGELEGSVSGPATSGAELTKVKSPKVLEKQKLIGTGDKSASKKLSKKKAKKSASGPSQSPNGDAQNIGLKSQSPGSSKKPTGQNSPQASTDEKPTVIDKAPESLANQMSSEVAVNDKPAHSLADDKSPPTVPKSPLGSANEKSSHDAANQKTPVVNKSPQGLVSEKSPGLIKSPQSKKSSVAGKRKQASLSPASTEALAAAPSTPSPAAKRARVSSDAPGNSAGTPMSQSETPNHQLVTLSTPQSVECASDGKRSVKFGKIFRKRFSKKDRVVTPTPSGDEKTPERSILKKRSGSPASALKLRSPASKKKSPKHRVF